MRRFLLTAVCALLSYAQFAAAQQPSRSTAPLQQNSVVTVPGAPNCPIFPADNVWNTDISQLPVDPNSAAYINAVGGAVHLHPDFGSFAGYGIPYNVVDSSVPKVTIPFLYQSDSDIGPYPVPQNYLVEGNDPSVCASDGSGGDCHVLIVDKDACVLYEIYSGYHLTDNARAAGSGAIWYLYSNALRTDGFTSADAAGLPILPGLVRYDEVLNAINNKVPIGHAFRFTVQHTKNAHIYPARHDAGSASYLPPMGLRVRLKASVDISKFSAQAQPIMQALKTYGMILADNGSNWYISGASDPNFDDNQLNDIKTLTGSELEVVDTSSLLNGPDPNFTLAVATPIVTFPNEPASFNGNILAIGGYPVQVNVQCGAGAPSTCVPTPAKVSPGMPFLINVSDNRTQDFTFPIQAVGTDPHALAHAQNVTLQVVDFNLTTPAPTVLNVFTGASVATNFQVTAAGSFAGSVTLSCGGLPNGATYNFIPSAQVSPTANAPVNVTLQVTVPGATLPANYPLSISANTAGAPAAKTQNVTLSVQDFALSATAPVGGITVAQGNPSSPVSFTVAGNIPSGVALGCSSGLPVGATCQFSPSSTVFPTAANPTSVSLVVLSGAAAVGGPTTVTITGTATGTNVSKTTSFQLTIQASALTADMSAMVTHGAPDPVMVGGITSFTVTLYNNSSSAQVAVSVLVTFSGDVIIGNAAGCNPAVGSTITCTAMLNSGSSQPFTIPVSVLFARSITAVAYASSNAMETMPMDNTSMPDVLQVRLRPRTKHPR